MSLRYDNSSAYRANMRRVIGLGIAVSLLATLAILAPAATAAGGDGAEFEDHGTVDLPSWPTPTTRCVGDDDSSSAVIEGVTPGRVFALTADAGSWQDDFDVTFYASLAACQAGAPLIPYKNHAGDENSIVPDGAAVGVVSLRTGKAPAAFTYRELGADPAQPKRPAHRAPTVIAVLEMIDDVHGFSPYHYDFRGSQHPWNVDTTRTDDDIDFGANPATYVNGYPEAATPLQLTLPDDPNASATALGDGDFTSVWSTMEVTNFADAPNLYWLPGTKVIGAIQFRGTKGLIRGLNEEHPTKVASVSGGNVHGTCPECLLVFVGFSGMDGAIEALEWAGQQPWIDVVTNSYQASYGKTDGLYIGGPEPAITKAAVKAGQTILWGSGNGFDGENAAVPNEAYASSEKGPDWGITVGGVSTLDDQWERGSGRPVDIASYSANYPSAGSTSVTGKSQFNGTSNATPVVAGTFAKVIQLSRDLFGDKKGGHKAGVVAKGDPLACTEPNAPCPLADGRFTRAELDALVFANVLPSPTREWPEAAAPGPPPPGATTTAGTVAPLGPTVPAGPVSDNRPAKTNPSVASYMGQGHGIVHGQLDPRQFVAEQRRFSDALRGAVTPYARPPGERTWMTVDSKCRQRLWGGWKQGYFKGTDPVFDPTVDQPALAFDAWCSAMPPDAFANSSIPGVPAVRQPGCQRVC
jgi:hypothetical protein